MDDHEARLRVVEERSQGNRTSLSMIERIGWMLAAATFGLAVKLAEPTVVPATPRVAGASISAN